MHVTILALKNGSVFVWHFTCPGVEMDLVSFATSLVLGSKGISVVVLAITYLGLKDLVLYLLCLSMDWIVGRECGRFDWDS